MIPARLDFPCRTNADYVEEFSVTNDGVPVDLTGYAASMVARFTLDGAAVLTLASVASAIEGIYIIEPSEGIWRVQINQETLDAAYDAVAVNATEGQVMNLIHDIKFVLPSALEEIWYEGLVVIRKGVTP